MTDKPMSQIIEDAHELLDKGRWVQNRYTDRMGGYCELGALGTVMGIDVQRDAHFVRAQGLMNELKRDLPEGHHWIPDFNDHPETTKEMVLDHLMTTAKRLRNEGR